MEMEEDVRGGLPIVQVPREGEDRGVRKVSETEETPHVLPRTVPVVFFINHARSRLCRMVFQVPLL